MRAAGRHLQQAGPRGRLRRGLWEIDILMEETRPSCVKQPEHVNSRSGWGGASQERLLGGGDVCPCLVSKEMMLVNCGGSLEGLASQKGKLAKAMAEKWDEQGVDWYRGEIGYEGSGGRAVPICRLHDLSGS